MNTKQITSIVLELSTAEMKRLDNKHPDMIRLQVEGETGFFEYTLLKGNPKI